MVNYCCEDMSENVFETPTTNEYNIENTDDNKTIYYSPRFREYGIPIKDNPYSLASSYIQIHYCPWCGKRLPTSKRDAWFEELQKLGYDAPMEQDIPEVFKTSIWYEEANSNTGNDFKNKNTDDGSMCSN